MSLHFPVDQTSSKPIINHKNEKVFLFMFKYSMYIKFNNNLSPKGPKHESQVKSRKTFRDPMD